MIQPIDLAFDPIWTTRLRRELAIVTRSFTQPEPGEKLWASLTQGEGPWNDFITRISNETMKYRPKNGAEFCMTRHDIVRRMYDRPKGHWLADLYTAAIHIRSTLLEHCILAATEDPLLILMI